MVIKKKIVIESPLRGKTPEEQRRNFRYALWCQRWVRLQGHTVYASHTNGPLFLDDSVPEERDLGIALTAEITNDSWHHWFFTDLNKDLLYESQGSFAAYEAFVTIRGRKYRFVSLRQEAPELWEAFQLGKWPPHTSGLL